MYSVEHDPYPIITIVLNNEIEQCLNSAERNLSRVLFGSKLHPVLEPVSEYIFSSACQEKLPKENNEPGKMQPSPFELNEQVKRALWETRCRLVFLLNTPGGLLSTYRKMVTLTNRVRKNGGTVIAYGNGRVDSAGARIFMLADQDRRFLEVNTHLFFHLSGLARGNTDSLADIIPHRQAELVDLQNLWTSAAASPEQAAKLSEILEDGDRKTALGEDIAWTFKPTDAATFWNVQIASTADLQNHYDQVLKRSTRRFSFESTKGTPIFSFFTRK